MSPRYEWFGKLTGFTWVLFLVDRKPLERMDNYRVVFSRPEYSPSYSK
jgi:hypothetical protein